MQSRSVAPRQTGYVTRETEHTALGSGCVLTKYQDWPPWRAMMREGSGAMGDDQCAQHGEVRVHFRVHPGKGLMCSVPSRFFPSP